MRYNKLEELVEKVDELMEGTESGWYKYYVSRDSQGVHLCYSSKFGNCNTNTDTLLTFKTVQEAYEVLNEAYMKCLDDTSLNVERILAYYKAYSHDS